MEVSVSLRVNLVVEVYSQEQINRVLLVKHLEEDSEELPEEAFLELQGQQEEDLLLEDLELINKINSQQEVYLEALQINNKILAVDYSTKIIIYLETKVVIVQANHLVGAFSKHNQQVDLVQVALDRIMIK